MSMIGGVDLIPVGAKGNSIGDAEALAELTIDTSQDHVIDCRSMSEDVLAMVIVGELVSEPFICNMALDQRSHRVG